jgi:hypothetical protein
MRKSPGKGHSQGQKYEPSKAKISAHGKILHSRFWPEMPRAAVILADTSNAPE